MRRHRADFAAVSGMLDRRGIEAGRVVREAMKFSLALPTWAFAQGGTRFGRFPLEGEPRTIFEKLDDAATVNRLTGIAPRISPHIPWDLVDNVSEVKRHAGRLGLSVDAVNSNTFQDQPGQRHSYKFGSLSHTQASVRRQAVEHHLECIQFGKAVGSKSLTVWLGDGGNFPGQQHMRSALERVIECLKVIHAALPSGWRMFIEYKPFEPAFYSTVVADWGTALMAAQQTGPKAFCLVDLGHHLPNTNIEMVVARLIAARRLGGFHFNDCKYADDDLSTGSLRPYQLFLIFNELVDAQRDPAIRRGTPEFAPAYMIDQSATIKDPIEDLIQSSVEIHRAYVKALLVDRKKLREFQQENDVVMAEAVLKTAFETNVSPILAEARLRKDGALDPVEVFRASSYRHRAAMVRR